MRNTIENGEAQSNHRKVKASVTLNRKYIKRPSVTNNQEVSVRRSPTIEHFHSQPINNTSSIQEKTMPDTNTSSPKQTMVNRRPNVATRANMHPQTMTNSITAKELKERAIKKALASAENDRLDAQQSKQSKTGNSNSKMHFGVGRVLIALGCAAAAVFAIVYFVNLNAPDISLKVAAMQTGVDPSYPSYIPRGYKVSSILSEDNRLTIEFRDAASSDTFSLTEEKSSWDSNALESNYIKKTYGDNYSAVREQGLTIYISGSDAAWVNGGKLYKIDSTSAYLTNKQIRAIATSL